MLSGSIRVDAMRAGLLSIKYPFVLLLLILSACEQPLPLTPVNNTYSKDFTSFTLRASDNPQLSQDVVCYIRGNTITGRVPYSDLKSVESINTSCVASFITTGVSVMVDSVIQESGITVNNFKNAVSYSVTALDNSVKIYSLQLAIDTGIPVLFINTENSDSILSKDTYLNATAYLDASIENPAWNFEGSLQVKGRGNSTWGMPKKPYKLKFTNKASLLGMPADKEWVLLANYSDKTLIRNYLAFQVSTWAGLPYTPRSTFVELFVNGSYYGNYQLTEQVKIAPNRVNIKEMTDDDITGDKVTGGYLLEVDARLGEDFWFYTTKNVPVTLNDPDDGIPQQVDYIHTYVQQTEDALFSDSFADETTGYAKYLDPDTFIKWYLVNELFKNNDANFYSSVYIYKDRLGKLCLGPVWDFDIAAGNINYNGNDNPEGWWVNTAPWIARLQQDPVFSQKTKAQWLLLREQLNGLDTFIDDTALKLKLSEENNFTKWNILNTYVWPNAVVTGSYKGEVSYLKTWMSQRIAWMDAQFSQSTN